MWSGPRNLSTAMMRSFGNRADVAEVRDEPFYGAYLAATGKEHPMRDAVLASQSPDWREVARACAVGGAPGRLVYQKHMTQHMMAHFGRDWMDEVAHVFLIRSPERVAASFAAKWEAAELEDIGFVQQAELFDRVADRMGAAPPVIDAEDVRADPEGALRRLCAALGLGFDKGMLGWPPGPRPSDGVWAAHWYRSVEASTGFSPAGPPPQQLTGRLAALAAAARPAYERLKRHAL